MSKFNVNRVKAGDLELKDKVVAINRVVKTTKNDQRPTTSKFTFCKKTSIFNFKVPYLIVIFGYTTHLYIFN